jgi:hypothetical protein
MTNATTATAHGSEVDFLWVEKSMPEVLSGVDGIRGIYTNDQ